MNEVDGMTDHERALVEAVGRFLRVVDHYGCYIGRGAGEGHETLDALRAALDAVSVQSTEGER